MCYLNVYAFCAEYLIFDSQLMCSFLKKAISPKEGYFSHSQHSLVSCSTLSKIESL